MNKIEFITLNKKGITDFAFERNELLKKAKSEWVFFVDSDEKLTPELCNEVNTRIKDKKFNGFYVKRKIFFLGKYIGTDRVLRLGRKNAGKWERAVHEKWKIKGKVGELTNPLIHNTAGSISKYITKLNYYSGIHAKENIKEKKKVNLFKLIFFPKMKFIENILSGRGMVFSILQAFHSFLAWVKVWELTHKKSEANKLNLKNVFLFLFLALFPFGQLVRVGIIQPIDIIIGLGAIYAIYSRVKKPNIFKYFTYFLATAVFSYLVSVFLFKQTEVFYGLLYLLRLGAYFYFLLYVVNFIRKEKPDTHFLSNALLSVSAISAIFGWIQYFKIPNLTPFIIWGWDDHLFRLTGTFMDPTFLGLIIVFGLLTSINRFIVSKSKSDLILTIFLLISLAFTYSRASYLAFIVSVLVLGVLHKKIKQLAFLILGLAFLIIVLPTSGNTILGITRTFSAIARVENYKETINIYKNYPLTGTGYNNLCLAKSQTSGLFNISSHACSGSDSSLLFILATTGIVGFLIFVNLLFQMAKTMWTIPKGKMFLSIMVATLVHSLFSNSMFYPWILGYIIILFGDIVTERN